jgi:hypothetical protein
MVILARLARYLPVLLFKIYIQAKSDEMKIQIKILYRSDYERCKTTIVTKEEFSLMTLHELSNMASETGGGFLRVCLQWITILRLRVNTVKLLPKSANAG